MSNTFTHDQNFKNLIIDYPRQALALFAAEEAAGIGDDAKITPIRQQQLKERLGGHFRELDTPILVEWPDGRREALLFALEEETDPRRFSIHRLAHYCLDLSELYGTTRVVPVVIFLGKAGRIARELVLGGDWHDYLNFFYLGCVLSELLAANHWDSGNLVARLNLPMMAGAASDKVAAYAQAIRGLLQLEPNPNKQLKYLDFIDFYAALDDNEIQRYKANHLKEEQTMAGLAESFRAEGRQQGMQQGELNVLYKQLQRRFGELDGATRKRLEQASREQLEQWAENVLDAKTLDEVFNRH